MKTQFTARITVLLLIAFMAGCGGGSGGSSGGGSLVGIWVVQNSDSTTNTTTFKSDGTWTWTGSQLGSPACNSSGTWSTSESNLTSTETASTCQFTLLNVAMTVTYSISADGNTLILVSTIAAVMVKQGTTVPPAPDAPTNITLTPGTGQVTVNWTAVSGANAYNVMYMPVSGGLVGFAAVTSGASVVITGLTSGTPYSFTVTAVNAGGQTSSMSQNATPL